MGYGHANGNFAKYINLKIYKFPLTFLGCQLLYYTRGGNGGNGFRISVNAESEERRYGSR